jgi:replicative DNA helicase
MEDLKHEEQIIYILLHNKDGAKSWANSQLDIPFFNETHAHILSGIKYAVVNDVTLTRNGFKEFLRALKNFTPAETAAQVSLFNRCSMQVTKPEDLPILLEKVKIDYVRRRSAQCIRDYGKDRDTLGDIGANKTLATKLLSLESSVVEKVSQFVQIKTYKEDYIADLKNRRANPNLRIATGIAELDHCMTMGLAPGHLTLFCAAPGGYKTTMMTNIAANLFNNGIKSLYIPVEMDSNEIVHKIVSREAQIDLYKLIQAEKLSDDEVKHAEDLMARWEAGDSDFGLLKVPERSKVSDIRHEIEKRISFFQPKVVFVDYVDNLRPEHRYSRSDEEMNEILQSLVAMGAALGFSVVSAAQLARDALKRLKEQKDGKNNAFDSADIRGGQVYTANAVNVFGQLKDPDDPTKLIVTCIKSRHGPMTFRNDASRAILAMKPGIAMIESEPDSATDFRSQEGQEFVGMIATPPPPVEEEGSPF